jgi:hypothetical protein
MDNAEQGESVKLFKDRLFRETRLLDHLRWRTGERGNHLCLFGRHQAFHDRPQPTGTRISKACGQYLIRVV